MLADRLRIIWRKYNFPIVFIPGLVLAHWAWFRLQENEAFVPKNLEHTNPIVKTYERTFIGGKKSASKGDEKGD